MDTGRGEEGEGEMCGESDMGTYGETYMKSIANLDLLYSSGTQAGALWQSRRVGWGGRWEEVSGGREHGCTYG